MSDRGGNGLNHSNVRKRGKPFTSLPFHGEHDYGDGNNNWKNRRLLEQHSEIQFLLFFFFYATVFSLIWYFDSVLPTVKTITESSVGIKNNEKDVFSEERARRYLEDFTRIGPRPTGSYENEVLAVDFLLRELKQIDLLYNNTANALEIDLQKTSGSFYVNFEEGMTSCYRNVKNVVVKLGPRNQELRKSILLNCHFDSVPTSPGTSDDAVGCSVMLEVLINLVQSKEPLPHSVIFLFNGAEENFLQASHGFITQHKWSKSVGAFINLEACGAGGKEVLFQAGPGNPWIVEAYANGAKHPFGSIIGQEVFQGGLIPSDTDFRIFRDFGKIPGLDFAYAKNGFVYHTRFDNVNYVTPGSLQHEGDNVLGVVWALLHHPQFKNPPKDQRGKLVYFDVIGLFMISYTAGTGLLLNVSVVLIALGTILASIIGRRFSATVRELVVAELVIFLSLVAAILSSLIVALLVDCLGVTLSWYSRPYWIIGLYVCPALLAMLFVNWIVSVKRKMPKDLPLDAEGIYFNAVLFFWCNNIIFMMAYNVHSAFLISFWVFFPSVVKICTKFVFGKTKKGDHLHGTIPHLAMQFIPMLLTLYCWWQLYVVFIPIMGRIGGQTNPDLLIGVISAIASFSLSSYMFPIVHTVKSIKKTAIVLSIITVVTLAIITFTSFGFPYSSDINYPAPQRFYIKHIERNFYSKSGNLIQNDSGFWIIPLDHNGPESVYEFAPELRNARLLNCDERFYCGMPFYFPVIKKISRLFYLPSVKPKIHTPKSFKLVAKEKVENDNWKLTFDVIGPDHMGVIICPYPGVRLTTWSLNNGSVNTEYFWQNRPVYLIFYSHGEESGVWQFWIQIKERGEFSADEPLIDLAFTSHHMHGHDSKTEALTTFVNKLPDWTHTIAWVATYDSYIF